MLNDKTPQSRLSLLELAMQLRRQLATFTAFTVLQAATYLIPVVTIPYFARTLTISGMGQLAIATAVALAASVVMDFGVVLSGTRFAAKNGDTPTALNAYLNATSALKLVLLLPMVLGLLIASWTFPDVSRHFWVYFWSMLSAGAVCFFPQWLFHGLRIMPVAVRILVVARVLAAGAALVLVRSPTDAFVVPMTQAITGTGAIVAAALFLRRRYAIEIGSCSRRQITAVARENWKLFSATAWGATHTHGSIILMGLMLPATSIGFYSIAQRISQAFVSIFNVAAQTGFPSFVRAHARATASFGRLVRLYLVIVSVCSLTCLVGMFALRVPLYGFFAGRHSELGLSIFSIWLFASFFTVISVSLNPIMVAMHLDSHMANVYRITGIGFLVLAPLASIYLGAIGVALATLFPECLMAIYCVIVVARGLRHDNPPKRL